MVNVLLSCFKKKRKKNNVNITEMNSVIPSLFFKMTGK